jgi:hypothetical protein
MSRELLQQLHEAHVFDAMLNELDFAAYHVPFDTLTGNRKTEARLRDAVGRVERVALVGLPGSGKTSVARFALDPPPDTIAPIWVPIAYKDPQVTSDPKSFAQYLVEVLANAATAANRLGRRQREEVLRGALSDEQLPAVARKRGLGLTVKAWILLGGVARDITRTHEAGRFPRSEEAVLDKANDLLESIRAYDLNPVLVMDDTDRLLGRRDADELISAFFGVVLRAVNDHLNAGIVVAAHPFYRRRDDYKKAVRGLIEHHIDIPVVPSADALGQILTPRIRFANRRRSADDAFDLDALRALFKLYKTAADQSIRATLAVAHNALRRARDAGVDKIAAEQVAAGADDALL